jgi:D-beta-D-heptose 7-phosphate kinase / D-beta-D-heptose 1-phosphate adenosyltransferase
MAQSTTCMNVPDLSAIKIAVIGDIMIDSWLQGQVHRISPEAPVPVVSVAQSHHILGGAANVARNVAHLGAQAQVLGVLGADTHAQVYHKLIENEPRMWDLSCTDSTRCTTVKTRVVGNHQQIVRLDQEHTHEISEHVLHQLKQNLRTHTKGLNAIIISDYAKGVVNSRMMQVVWTSMHELDIPVLVDPKTTQWQQYQGATCITPNWSEFQSTVRAHGLAHLDMIPAARTLIKQYDLGAILITRAEQGMMCVTLDAHQEIPAIMREVRDVSGAGDTVIATLACVLAAGEYLLHAAQLSNLAAGISVSKAGTATVSMQELQQALHN